MFGGNKSTGVANQPSLSSLTESPCRIRVDAGVPPLAPAGDEQPGQQQADDYTDPLSQNLFQGQDEDAEPILEGESGTQDESENSPVVETVEDSGNGGNAVGRESQDAETMIPTVQDQGNAVGGGGSTAETMNPTEGDQGNAVGNGQPSAETRNPAVPSTARRQSTLGAVFDLFSSGTKSYSRRFSRQPDPNTPAASTTATPQRQGAVPATASNVTVRPPGSVPPASAFATVTQSQRRVTINAPNQSGRQSSQQSNPANAGGGSQPNLANAGGGGQPNPTNATGGQGNAPNPPNVQPNPANAAGGQQNMAGGQGNAANAAGGQANAANAGGGQQQRPWYQRTGATPPPGVPIPAHNRAFWEEFRDEDIAIVVEHLVIGPQHPAYQVTVNTLTNVVGCFTAGDLDGLRKLDFTAAGMQVAPAVKLERVARYYEYVQQEHRAFTELSMFREWMRTENRAAAPNVGGQAGRQGGGIDRQCKEESRRPELLQNEVWCSCAEKLQGSNDAG